MDRLGTRAGNFDQEEGQAGLETNPLHSRSAAQTKSFQSTTARKGRKRPGAAAPARRSSSAYNDGRPMDLAGRESRVHAARGRMTQYSQRDSVHVLRFHGFVFVPARPNSILTDASRAPPAFVFLVLILILVIIILAHSSRMYQPSTPSPATGPSRRIASHRRRQRHQQR